MEQNFADCCIICLEKNTDTINLAENSEKLNELSLLSNCEFINYTEYSQLLCTSCDEKLELSYNFLQQIWKSIQILDNHKIKHEKIEYCTTETLYESSSAQEEKFPEDEYSHEDPLAFLETANVTRKLTADSIKIVPFEEANKVIDEFKTFLHAKKDCICCNFTGSSRRSLSSHMQYAHRDKKKIWCRDCNKLFEDIDEHKKTHTSEHFCPFCEKKKNSSHFVEHILSHTGKFECKICEKKFNSEAWLRKHKLIHTEARPYQCPNCSRGFIQISSLRYHLTTHGEYSCQVCKKHFETEKKLESHECVESDKIEVTSDFKKLMMKFETDENSENTKSIEDENNQISFGVEKSEINYSLPKKFECPICQKKFMTGHRFRLHIRKHRGTLPYTCTYCHKTIADRTEFNNHKRVHTKEKPFECSYCKKMFSQKSTLATHMKIHTGRPEVCDICGKRFCRKAELRMHLSKHKGEKPFLCMVCGKAFSQNSHLTEHMLGHGEERPYQCSFCDKAFKKNAVLKSHLRLHMAQKPLKCEYCSYSCYTTYRLQQHMAKLHDKVLERSSTKGAEVSEDEEKIKLVETPVN